MKKVLSIVGARPQFIKHFPFELQAQKYFEIYTIHTGQHYDDNMSKIFFDQLGMNRPDFQLDVGSGSHGVQTGKMMIEIERVIDEIKPDAINVYGDTNSTLAGALVASKLNIPIIHIEAGLRSFNKRMPEEINRICTDHLASLLFVPSVLAVKNLQNEGITQDVFVVGDIMKDLVLYSISNNLLGERKVTRPYYYATLHRPYNTDSKLRLKYVLDSLNKLDEVVIFSLHPRTANAFKRFGLSKKDFTNIKFVAPASYFDNLNYLYFSHGLLTDSGGMQKEAYWLSKKCITIRTETEWVETLEGGNNTLLFSNLERMQEELKKPLIEKDDNLYGTGNSAKDICDQILNFLEGGDQE